MEVDQISRIRSASGDWELYTAEDIRGGMIVFEGVEAVQLEPPGPLPNDLISGLSVRPVSDGNGQRWIFEASIGSVGADGRSTEVTVRIVGAGVHLEDPARPGLEIRE